MCWLSKENFQVSKNAKKRVINGTHHFLGGEIARTQAIKRLTTGTHNFQRHYECPHCGKMGKGVGMLRWHFDNCKSINNKSQYINIKN